MIKSTHAGAICALSLALAMTAAAQPADPAHASAEEPQAAEKIDKRAYGVIPNYRTADGSLPYKPITARQKMTIAARDSFDWPIYLTSAAFAGIYHWENQNPSFGQGFQGFAKRYGASFVDQMLGNMMTEGIMPSLLCEDPRYFRKGKGTTSDRLGYAATRTMVTRTDSGKRRFNYSEWIGNSAAVAFSNVYYPDTRTARDNIQKLCVQVGVDSLSNVMKEFWPDIKRKFRPPDLAQ